MARCRKKHDFGEWNIYRYEFTQGLRKILVEDPEKYLKETKERVEKEKKEAELKGNKLFTIWFNEKVTWKRICKKCGKVDDTWIHYNERPKDYEVKVKSTPSLKKERNLTSVRDTKISKGWKRE